MTETFTWCPAPNIGLTRRPRITEVRYGDGYTHRATIGINIFDDVFAATFAGNAATINAIDAFLVANALGGFYFQWAAGALVTCDEWVVTWVDRSKSDGLLGNLSAQFRRAYNLQPTA